MSCERGCLAVVLAAGNGSRMKVPFVSKGLHVLAGRPMLWHVVTLAVACGASKIAVVVNPVDLDSLVAAVSDIGVNVEFCVQKEPRGTAHAVLAARSLIDGWVGEVIVLFCDTPLLSSSTVMRLRKKLLAGADLVALGFEKKDTFGYGRFMLNDAGYLIRIVEEGEADIETTGFSLLNSGVMAFNAFHTLSLLDAVEADNAKMEYYLSEVVSIASGRGLVVDHVVGSEDECLGVNDFVQLSVCERIYQSNCRISAMKLGVRLVAPETVFFSHDTVLGAGVIVEPNVVFGPRVIVAPGVRIRAFSYIEGTTVAGGTTIGPYARIRGETEIGTMARIGNFVEVKNSIIGNEVKLSHLSYIGDAQIGCNVNIGAGAITCNYDGFCKRRTTVNKGAFVGADTVLVAPVTIGANAYVAAGSVITEDVPAEALAVSRSPQNNKADYVMALPHRNKSAINTTSS